MARIVKSFRIEKEIWDAVVAEKQCPSRLIRLFILAGVHQMKIPHYDEILLLTKLEEDARKVGVNTNQAVRALNTTLIKKQSLEEKNFTGFTACLPGTSRSPNGDSQLGSDVLQQPNRNI